MQIHTIYVLKSKFVKQKSSIKFQSLKKSRNHLNVVFFHFLKDEFSMFYKQSCPFQCLSLKKYSILNLKHFNIIISFLLRSFIACAFYFDKNVIKSNLGNDSVGSSRPYFYPSLLQKFPESYSVGFSRS